MDDMLLRATSPEENVFHAQLVMLTLLSLGFSFNLKKCSLIQSQRVVHLGFVIDTVLMTISCPEEKVTAVMSGSSC